MANVEKLATDEALVRALKPSDDALRLHPIYRAKMQTLPKCAVRGFAALAIRYTGTSPRPAERSRPSLMRAGLILEPPPEGTP